MRSFILIFLFLLAATPGESKTIAIDVPADVREIEDSLRINDWIDWLRRVDETLDIVAGPGVRGDIEILVRPSPVDDITRRLLDGLPVGWDDKGLRLGEATYAKPSLTLAVRLPDAAKRTWLVIGRDPERLAAGARMVMLKEAGARAWDRDNKPFDFLLRESAWLERSGLWQKTEAGWGIATETERDDFQSRDAAYAAMRPIPGRWVELRASAAMVARQDLKALAARLDSATGAMAKRIPLALAQPIRVIIEDDHVAQGRHLGDIGEAVLTSEGSVHLVWHPDDADTYLHQIARALLVRAKLSEDLPLWIENGAALWLSRGWFGRDFEAWLPRLATARVLPTAEQLLATEQQEDSSAPLWIPAAASLVGASPGETLRKKLSRLPDPSGVTQHLSSLAGLKRPSTKTEIPTVPFLKGVSFAMFNRIDGGYHAPIVDERLEHLKKIGSNAISLMPFAYQPKADGSELRFLTQSPASETDIGTIYSARRAHAAGFHVLWKPHIWISGDSWPGDVAMPDDATWAAWFTSYRRYIAHHAFLAEWAGCDLFSIGVELGQTLERKTEWEEVIASVRTLFSGAVTYSGNWFGDYDKAPFWDHLDFIGVDAYFPLSHEQNAQPTALAEGARSVAAQLKQAAKRFGKPMILTEVGYAARSGAWVEPHREGGEFSAEDQAIAYTALLEALGRPSWLRGIFAWKVFSTERGNPDRPDFRFLGRPAEKVVRDYFSSASETGVGSQP